MFQNKTRGPHLLARKVTQDLNRPRLQGDLSLSFARPRRLHYTVLSLKTQRPGKGTLPLPMGAAGHGPARAARSAIMTDVFDAETRSRIMASIRGKNTLPERMLRRALHNRGLRYRLHDKRLPGRPDLVFRQFSAVCLVHGCFWHRHAGCRYADTPATRTEFWKRKFERTVARDSRNEKALQAAGWRVATVWECALRRHRVADVAQNLEEWLRGHEPSFSSESLD